MIADPATDPLYRSPTWSAITRLAAAPPMVSLAHFPAASRDQLWLCIDELIVPVEMFPSKNCVRRFRPC